MESASQAAYDRDAAWDALPYEIRKESKGRPRLRIEHYDVLFAAIALGPARATLEDLRAARQVLADAERVSEDAARHDRLEEWGKMLARLVWNNAEDRTFLDMVIAQELGSCEFTGVYISPYENFTVRVVLCQLADELRRLFPQRPLMEVPR